MRRLTALALAALTLSSCKSPSTTDVPASPKGDGLLVGSGSASDVVPSPDGSSVAWLAGAERPKDFALRLPEDVKVGTVKVAPATGGAAASAGEDVSNLPGSYSFSRDGQKLAVLARYDFRKRVGTLLVTDVRGGKPREVAPAVSFFAFGKKGHLAYVSDGKLVIEPPTGEAYSPLDGVDTVDFSPDGSRILTRKRTVDGGALYRLDLDRPGPPNELAASVADYNWSPDGSAIAFTSRNAEYQYELYLAPEAGKARRIGTGVPSYKFSPDGKSLAFVGNVTPQKQLGELFLLAPGADTAARLGASVNGYDFDPAGDRLAWVEGYDNNARVGTLAWAAVSPHPVPVKVGPGISTMLWSRTGRWLAYVQRTLKPVFSVDLFLYEAKPEGASVAAATGVFGFDFTRDDSELIFAGNCTRAGRSCDLLAVPTATPKLTPRQLAHGVNTFEFDPGKNVLMLTYARLDVNALDLAVVPVDGSAQPHTIDRMVQPGTRFLGPDGARITYAVMEKAREGVYVAPVPDFKAAPQAAKQPGVTP